MTIRLGTEGWRGVIGRDFTIANARAFAQGAAGWIKASGPAEAGAVVGYDTRFMSDAYARELAEVLAYNGVPVHFSTHAIPTPVLSFAVQELGATAGLMVTASHNPPQYNGIKLKGSHGGPVFGDDLALIEANLGQDSGAGAGPAPVASIRQFDPDPHYLARVARLIDLDAIRRSGLTVVVDCMHGAGRNYLRRILAKGGIAVRQLHAKPDPTFGGVNPEPLETNLTRLRKAVLAFGADIGLATDGDGDRLGVIDHRGDFVNPHQVFGILLRYLAGGKAERGGVVKTFSTTRMIDRLALAYGLPLFETPVGFKHISRLFTQADILIGGEESGGLGVRGHIPERDGILAGLLLLEAISTTGRSLASLVRDLFAAVGPHHYRRLDVALSSGGLRHPDDRPVLPSGGGLTPPPDRLAGYPVTDVKTLDGTKLELGDDGWILFRPSGTEPLVRIYVEASTPEEVERILAAGARLVSAGVPPR